MRRGAFLVGVLVTTALGVVLAAGLLATLIGGSSGPGAEPGAFTRRVPRTLPGPDAPAVDWVAPVRGEPMTVAAADADVVATALGEVRMLDGASGTTRWRTYVEGLSRARPAVSATTVAVTTETEVVIIDRLTGRVLASARSDAAASPVIGIGPSGSELVIVASETGAILAIDAPTGESRWSAQYAGSVPMAPMVDRGVVIATWYSPTSTVLRALDIGTGTERWRREVGARSSAPLVAAGSVLIHAGSGVTDARAQAFDLLTGAERWSTPLPGYAERLVRPASDGTTAYLLDGAGTVTALDLRTGAVRWQQATGAAVIDSPVAVTAGSVLFTSFSDALVVLDRSTGWIRSADIQPGVPIDVTAIASTQTGPGHLVLALRLAAPSRVEARPVP